MKSMLVAIGLVFLSSIQLLNAEITTVILNENELTGSCTDVCEEIPYINDKHGCKAITGCRLSRTGWNKGFVRCDYCACNCEKSLDRRTLKITKKVIGITESDLFDTCTNTCNKGGLVRTNFHNCDEIRDCRKSRNGWIRGTVRCDHCTCDCVVKTYAEKYRLENVVYDLSEAASEEEAELITMAQTIVENNSGQEQTSTRMFSFSAASSTMVTNSAGLQVGMSVTVSAGATSGAFNAGVSATSSLTTSYNYTTGEKKSESKKDTVSAEITVPPHSSAQVMIVGHRMNINVPYKGTLVTEYKDGTTSEKETTGVYSKVTMGKFRVTYGKISPLSK